jgi:hypothetical protein
MKKYLPLLFIMAFLSACQDESQQSEDNVFVVVDRSSNRTLSIYETDSKDRIVRTQSFDPSGYIGQSREFQYDENGYVGMMTEQKRGKAPRTTYYSNVLIRDTQGRVETVRTITSDGDKLETYYGYDENGILRGTSQTFNDDSVIMKDY